MSEEIPGLDAREKLSYDAGWRSSLDRNALDACDGSEVFAEAEHYAAALRAALVVHSDEWGTGDCAECTHESAVKYPCRTVKAIEDILAAPAPYKLKASS